MEIGTLRGLGTALVLIAFAGLLLWAFSGKRKKNFDEAANLPFADEPETPEKPTSDEHASRSNKE
ncbi:cbb3-type cytochrome oxidase subunit 3 [Geopseudomonas guangdongensis]|uniref:Cytochrome c oxidase cbb3-type subunit 4 n=1 Tax=Geopseudomonas guangdongensis TaxID=1245526 RepID=A0A1H2HM56_9GAMM|nr:cbb3-type cytochrome c oxidase subunit 3 [Pseudomonas guangdongensis]SDU32658.1 cytochrome c oxidase cbb3-type subunit 4 [Pseudomonas guangdongensis]